MTKEHVYVTVFRNNNDGNNKVICKPVSCVFLNVISVVSDIKCSNQKKDFRMIVHFQTVGWLGMAASLVRFHGTSG